MASGRLVVVSNRLPVSLRRVGVSGGAEAPPRAGETLPRSTPAKVTWRTEQSSGGLQSALGPILRGAGRPLDRLARHGAAAARTRGGTSSSPAGRSGTATSRWTCRPTWPGASTRATRTRRCGRSSTSSPRTSSSTREEWAAYVTANRRFRDAVLEQLQPGDTRLDPRLPPDAAAPDDAGRGARGPHRVLPPHPVPRLGAVPHPAPAGRGPARHAGRRPPGVPDPRRPAALPQQPGARSSACPAAWTGGQRPGLLHPPGGAAHRHRPAGVRGVPGDRTGPRRRPSTSCGGASRGGGSLLARGPHGLHEGHPPAPARVPQAAGGGAPPARARWCWSRWRCPPRAHPAVRGAAPPGERAGGRGERRVRHAGLDARGRTCAAASPARSWSRCTRRRTWAG